MMPQESKRTELQCKYSFFYLQFIDYEVFSGSRGLVWLENQKQIMKSTELDFAFDQLVDITQTGNHITRMLTVPDILQIGGYAAVEYCGGPQMIFQMGREHVEEEMDVVQHEPETYNGSLVVSGLSKMDLTPEEFVAMMGSFTIGFVSEERKGPHTRWTQNPYVFNNSYYQELLLGDKSKYHKTEADMKLVQTPELRGWVEQYADDQELFFRNYAKAHVKLSEITQEEILMSEFAQNYRQGGGYQELSWPRAGLAVVKSLMNGEERGEDWVRENFYDKIEATKQKQLDVKKD